MEFDGKVVHFNIFDALKYPHESNSIFSVSVIDPIVQEVFELNGRDELEVTLTKHLKLETICDVELNNELQCVVEVLQLLTSTSVRYGLAHIFCT